jgi:hypothetical protein
MIVDRLHGSWQDMVISRTIQEEQGTKQSAKWHSYFEKARLRPSWIAFNRHRCSEKSEVLQHVNTIWKIYRVLSSTFEP